MTNEVVNATNDQIEMIEDKDASLTVRTKESLRQAFKDVDGKTDNEKLLKLMELYEKFQATQDKFNVDSNIDVIDKAIATITSQIKAIVGSVNQYERTLNEKYIEDVADKMIILKEQIENEDILKGNLIGLQRDLEQMTKRYEDKEKMLSQSIDKIRNIEEENKNYIALNNKLVSKENDYINQLREKDNIINSKELEINQLTNDYESKMKALEGQYKANLEQLEVDNKAKIETLENSNKQSIKELENKLVGADKEKAILESNIKSLKDNKIALEHQNTEYKASIEAMRKEHKEDIKAIEKEYKADIKALEGNIKELEKASKGIELEKAKLESKNDSLEGNIKALEEGKKALETLVESQKQSLEDTTREKQKADELIAKISEENKALREELEKLKSNKAATKGK